MVNSPDTSLAATPLMLAAAPGHSGCLQLLLSYGSDTASHDLRGHTALAWAVIAGQEEAVRLLLAADKQAVCGRDQRGRTPTHLAAAHGQVNIVFSPLSQHTLGECVGCTAGGVQQGSEAA